LRRWQAAQTIPAMTNADTTMQSQGSPFWRFSLRFYREPGVAEACIALQEEAGVDVNLLMYLLWHATRLRAFSADEVASLESKIGPWREATVVPLRSVRRALKTPPALVPAATAGAFRNRIKAVELEAERLQQEAMYAIEQAAPARSPEPTPSAAAQKSLAAYETICRARLPSAARDAVLAAYSKLHPKGE
jgi:uncharacterized protein (TIGR02444 family)